MLSVIEAAEKLNVKPATIRRWVSEGHLSRKHDKSKRGAPLQIDPVELETVRAKVARPGRPMSVK
jgi:uncharacterized protein YjcR